jgi:PPE-repeat protein
MSAAAAWSALAAELDSAATGYDKVLATLSGEEWLGPASALMARAAIPYLAWLSTTAEQAEQAATQARLAAAAYETAIAATVPSPLVAANRVELTQLLNTNVLGQNAGAIAANEAQYGQMWAQDATAMYGYAGQAAAATRLTPFTSAPQIANPTAQAVQTSAVAGGAGSAGSAQSTLTQLITGLPNQLQSLASPLSSVSSKVASNPVLTEIWFLLSGQSTLPNNLGTLVTGYNSYSALWYNTEGLPYFSVGMANFGVQIAKTTGAIGGAAPGAAAAAVPKGLGGLGGMLSGGGGSTTAGLGNAASIGKLSVPPAWAGASPTPGHSGPLVVENLAPASSDAGGPGNLLGGMPLAGPGMGQGGASPKYGVRPTVMTRPPFAG